MKRIALGLLAAGSALLTAACTCPSKNAEIEGHLLVTSPGQGDLQPLKAEAPFIGGATIVECLRGEACPELIVTLSNVYEARKDCSRESGVPFCFDLQLRLTPGRKGPMHTERVCAGDPGRPLTLDYSQFPGKTPQAREGTASWQAGCVELRYAGETLDVRFEDVRLQLDSGRAVELRGRFGLSDPRDRATC